MEECWAMQNLCWKSTYFDNSNCKLLNTKCEEMNASPCTASDCKGPPNYMKDLTPALGSSPANIPPPVNDSGVIPRDNQVSSGSTSASISSSAKESSTSATGSASTTTFSAVDAAPTTMVSTSPIVTAVSQSSSDTATSASSYNYGSASSQSTSDAVVGSPTTSSSGTNPTPITSPTDSCGAITETVTATVTTTVQPNGRGYRRT